MPTSDICHLKVWLVALARDMEAADTRNKIEKCLREQRILWTSIRYHYVSSDLLNTELLRFSGFVFNILESRAFPDDRQIFDLASINLRAARLLGGRRNCHGQRCLCRALHATSHPDTNRNVAVTPGSALMSEEAVSVGS
jgi:hypothetical protein